MPAHIGARRAFNLGVASLGAGGGSVLPLSIVTTGQSTAAYTIQFALAEMNVGLAALLTPPGARMAQGATNGTFLRKSSANGQTNYWVNDDTTAYAVGPVMQTCIDMIAAEVAAGRRIGAFLAAGHESEAGQVGTTGKQTAYRAIQKWVWDTLRAIVVAYGQPAPPVITCVLGRRGDDPYSFNDGVQFIKASQRQFAADFPWIYNMPEVHDIQTDGGAHLATAGSPNGWQQAAPRYTRKVGKVLGATVTGGVDGPRITGAVRASESTDVLVTIAHDGGTDFTPTTDIQPFRYLVNGSAATISAAVRVNTTTVRLTLAVVPANGAAEQLQYAYGAMTGTDYSKALKDNQAVPLPLRWYDGAVTVTGTGDTTAPTVTSNGTGSTANNTPYSETLTANEAATFAKGTGDQTAAFTLTTATATTATLTLPATTTVGTYIANLTATDAAGNVRNFSRTVTVTAVSSNPEMVVAGDMSDPSKWTFSNGGASAISSGVMTFEHSSTLANAKPAFTTGSTLPAGTYIVETTYTELTNSTTGNGFSSVGNTAANLIASGGVSGQVVSSAPKVVTDTITLSADGAIGLRTRGATGPVAKITKFSVRRQ